MLGSVRSQSMATRVCGFVVGVSMCLLWTPRFTIARTFLWDVSPSDEGRSCRSSSLGTEDGEGRSLPGLSAPEQAAASRPDSHGPGLGKVADLSGDDRVHQSGEKKLAMLAGHGRMAELGKHELGLSLDGEKVLGGEGPDSAMGSCQDGLGLGQLLRGYGVVVVHVPIMDPPFHDCKDFLVGCFT